MAYWLLKSEPDEYSYWMLACVGLGTWNGVRNPFALANIRRMQQGDEAFFYHTGKEKQIVGVATIASQPYTEAKTGYPVIDVSPKHALQNPVTLAMVKSDPFFAGWYLVRAPRLSVMPVEPEVWRRVMQMSESESCS